MKDNIDPSVETDASAAATETPSKGRILIVDDEPVVCDMLKEMLGDYEVHVANDTVTARAVLEAAEYDIHLVLLDLVLPGERGEDFLVWLKGECPEIEVVIISNSRDEKHVINCLSRGASDFLEKPFRMEKVLRSVNRVIRRGLRRRLQERSDADPAPKAKTAAHGISAVTPAEGWMELTAPSEFEYIGRLQRFVEVLFASRLSDEDCEDLRMAIEEIGRNAIEWGNRFDPDKQIRISYCFFHDRIVLKFEDEGEGFAPSTLPDPSRDPATHLKHRQQKGKRPGGFGVFLVHNIMDEVVYSERGNVVLMTKFFK